MADITQFLTAITVGARVQEATGDMAASASAAGYAAWVQSITGTVPGVTKLADNRVQLALSGSQVSTMQSWLDNQVSGMLRKGPPPTVDYQMGKFLGPWAVKYFVPVGVGLFVLGWISAYYLQR